jgi:hypothetical protein
MKCRAHDAGKSCLVANQIFAAIRVQPLPRFRRGSNTQKYIVRSPSLLVSMFPSSMGKMFERGNASWYPHLEVGLVCYKCHDSIAIDSYSAPHSCCSLAQLWLHHVSSVGRNNAHIVSASSFSTTTLVSSRSAQVERHRSKSSWWTGELRTCCFRKPMLSLCNCALDFRGMSVEICLA